MRKIKAHIIILTLVLIWLFLAKVFNGSWELNQHFMLGSLKVHYYGLIMALAVGAGYWLAMSRAKVYNIEKILAERILFWAVIGGFVGARLYHVMSSWQFYLENPTAIIQVWNGGLSIFGALFGGIITTVVIYYKHRGVPLLSVFDWLAPSFALGHIIGRFGNLFNYEAFGYPTNLSWKMFVPEHFRPFESLASSFYHPLFLYEILGSVIILVVLLKLAKRPWLQGRSGAIFFSYLFLYNTLRFFIEFLRVDSTFIGSIRLNSVTSFMLAVAGLLGMYIVNRLKILRVNA